MDFICLPIIFGCSTRLSQDGDPSPRVCPRCNNASVISAKSREVFEICWIPLIPFKSKRIWHCNICQWQVPQQPGYEPARPGIFSSGGWQQPQGSNWQSQGPQNSQPGYQPGYRK